MTDPRFLVVIFWACLYPRCPAAQEPRAAAARQPTQPQAVPAVAAAPASSGASVPAESKPMTQASSRQKAIDLLESGLAETSKSRRAVAVRVLSMVPGERWAVTAAENAMKDDKPEVRAAAAFSLGELRDAGAIPALKEALDDQETLVALAAAHALLLLKDTSGYDVYYAILMGDRKGKGLVADQIATLKDPKKMAIMGFEEGIGYVPFAGIGYDAIRTIVKNGGDSTPVRAAAAKVLTNDPARITADALIQVALTDKSPIVRMAALDALSRRGDPSLMERMAAALQDGNDAVQFTAACAILHLSDLATATRKPRKSGFPPHRK